MLISLVKTYPDHEQKVTTISIPGPEKLSAYLGKIKNGKDLTLFLQVFSQDKTKRV
jgi:hypothetical protein